MLIWFQSRRHRRAQERELQSRRVRPTAHTTLAQCPGGRYVVKTPIRFFQRKGPSDVCSWAFCHVTGVQLGLERASGVTDSRAKKMGIRERGLCCAQLDVGRRRRHNTAAEGFDRLGRVYVNGFGVVAHRGGLRSIGEIFSLEAPPRVEPPPLEMLSKSGSSGTDDAMGHRVYIR
jgi:hypothetical protein